MMMRNAADSRRGVMPPLLVEQETLVDQVEGPALPSLSPKPIVLRQGFDACRAGWMTACFQGIGAKAYRFA